MYAWQRRFAEPKPALFAHGLSGYVEHVTNSISHRTSCRLKRAQKRLLANGRSGPEGMDNVGVHRSFLGFTPGNSAGQ